MPFLTADERRFMEAAAELTHVNPFLPERIECERRVLGAEFVPQEMVWSPRPEAPAEPPNVLTMSRRVEELVSTLRARLSGKARLAAGEAELYRDLVAYALYYRCQEAFCKMIPETETLPAAEGAKRVPFWRTFRRDAQELLGPVGGVDDTTTAHLFASCFQVRRAFHYIFRFIMGGSMAAARLRAAVWQSIFTHDMRRYRRALYERMGDITVLITGPSGTGKELVARAVAFSRYIPFDPTRECFAVLPGAGFYAVNLAALSPTLIESELFGHRRGAFTGALEDHPGWLETCGPLGTVFLDEIGEVDLGLQVKLLRVLETRTFQRLGETQPRRFAGKLVAATNRNLAERMACGAFREDLYYRLCSDMIRTPSLREQVQDSPGELHSLVLFLARRLVGDAEADALTREVEQWITPSLGRDYAWPGNVRELDQCIRNILIRKEYRPPEKATPEDDFHEAFATGRLTAEEVLRRYCTVVYAQTRNYLETGRRLGLDRRTVKSKVDREYLARLGVEVGADADEE
ncbi:MAG: hypothetical protein A3K19_11890 [Lentisphaerae bacterium RIFOXYB12_FULL_65_16]|nr:MAG: hypothetical protein A3K18_27130 [Lentisphaerae bacterium RIFOXYA12_64_32]OGV87961.1 MAG: hypothetical protein A3K19_11890 [Lentisphaerae bacterium RIFOXYB12_FULL_65_16]